LHARGVRPPGARLLPAASLLLAALLTGCTGGSPRDVGPLVGNLAPDFSVTPAGGASAWDLHEQRGKVVMVDLMGVNCAPCRREMTHLLALAGDHANDTGFTMLSVDMASVYPGLGARNASEIVSFRQEFGAAWPFAPDEGGLVGRAYEPIALPTKVLIGADGVIRAKIAKEITSEAELEQAVEGARRT
jgi:thiol-disulfide isomerase/thioredoxin